MSLATIGDIGREQARVYRATLNGRLASDEGTRLTYMLTQIRTTIEAAQAAVDITPLAAPAVTVHILPIAAGSFLSPEDVARARRGEPLALELAPAEPPPAKSLGESPPAGDERVVAFPSRRAEESEPPPAA
jgi:hypothetical protein